MLNWLCCIISCEIIPLSKMPFFKQLLEKATNANLLKVGGNILMSINNSLMMVQTGFPTGKCEVRSRLEQLWKRSDK